MSRRAMTLVEMLVATTATLILMAAVAQAFAVFGSAISGSRGVLELDARMRSAAWRLRSDLAGITVRPLPPITPETAQGYLEIIEGPLSDYQDASNSGAALLSGTTLVGPSDVDDVLLFTTRIPETPFIGRGPSGGTLESTAAEVAWFARPTPGSANPPTYTLYRKQLLVMGYVGVAPFSDEDSNSVDWATAGSSWSAFYNLPCDVSVRREGNALVPNTLADLSRREARFLHNTAGIISAAAFPYRFLDGTSHQLVEVANPTQLPAALAGLTFDPVTPGTVAPRQGEDVVLTDVIAFDVRVFDPAVAVQVPGSTPLVPGDPLFVTASSGTATGGYVDLGHGGNVNSLLTGDAPRFHDATPQQVAGTAATLTRTYDTWTLAYEANGINEDEDEDENAVDVTDEAFDGKDNDGNGLIDDPAEFETRPPYPYPLRGIEVRIRCYEPSSRQVRQVTVRHTFVPH